MNIEMTPKLFQTTYSLPQIFYLPLCTLNGGDGDPTWIWHFHILKGLYKTIFHCGLFIICQNSTKLLPWTTRTSWFRNKTEETGVHSVQIDSSIRDTLHHALIKSQVSLAEHLTLPLTISLVTLLTVCHTIHRCWFGEFKIGSTNNPLIDIFRCFCN